MMPHSTVFTIAISAISLIYLALGWYGRVCILRSNPCSMTYTSRDRAQVDVSSNIYTNNNSCKSIYSSLINNSKQYKLWKYSLPKHDSLLNAHPVLFIHGHLGMADQVRSLSSTMHNKDNFFQYFSLDFNVSLSGLHASEVITQAIYTNDALNSIYDMYHKQYQTSKDAFKIIIVSHSIGASIARTALLLSNHPSSCYVSDIIMLSSPTVRSPYAPDASLNVLYSSLNNAWRQSYYNESKQCSRLMNKEIFDGDGYGDGDATVKQRDVVANWNCPKCVPVTRVISITGGDIDIQVNPSITRLDAITPMPSNRSLENISKKSKQASLSSYFSIGSTIMSVVSSPIDICMYTLNQCMSYGKLISEYSAYFSSTGNSTANTTSATDTSSATDSSGNDTCDNNESTNTSTASAATPDVYSIFKSTTIADWKQHIPYYIEPQFLSIRASQIVGFPIDHLAILWCKEIVASVSHAMKRLSSTDKNKAIDLYKLFNLKASQVVPSLELQEHLNDMITPIQEYLKRNESSSRWTEAGTKIDKAFYQSVEYATYIHFGSLQYSAVDYVNNSLHQILLCYLLIAMLSTSAVLLSKLSGTYDKCGSSSDEWTMAQPWYHLHLHILCPSWQRLVRTLVEENYQQLDMLESVNNAITTACSLTLSLRLLYDFYFYPIASYHFYVMLCHWFVSYGLAVSLRYLLLVVTYGVRYITGTAVSLVKMVVWGKAVRKYLKKPVLQLTRYIGVSSVILGSAVLIYYTSDRVIGSAAVLSVYIYTVSVVTVVSTTSLAVLTALAIALPSDETDTYRETTNMLLLYWPAALLSLPSALYACKLLFDDRSTVVAMMPVMYVFEPERLNCCFSIVLIALHVYMSRFDSYATSSSVASVPFLVNAFGTSSDSNDSSHDSSTSSSSSVCYHEDGGRYAIYQEDALASPTKQVAVTRNIIVGSMFRVVSCNCMKDRMLKDHSEWCEYCRCRKCNGKNLPTVISRHDNRSGSSSGSGALYTDVDRNMCLLFGLNLLILSVVYTIYSVSSSNDSSSLRDIYRVMYSLSLVAGLHMCRDVFSIIYSYQAVKAVKK